ncbi:MAG: aminotransferase class I/II-fold pyridoxal phosphate-dependent enzyme [Candidatus Micrarchaeia archaeon]
MIPYGRQNVNDDDAAAVARVLRSAFLTQGPLVEEFESALAKKLGAKHCVVLSNGTAALQLALAAAQLPKNSEVITTPVTFAATANACLYNSLKPVFSDVEAETMNLDASKIRVTRKTKALLPVHYAGHPCDLDAFRETAEEKDLFLLEDACHALGAEYKGKRIGSRGTCALSFHPVKHITTGEGGAVVTDDGKIAERCRLLRSHGITKNIKGKPAWYNAMLELSYNYRITDIQCALGLSQLGRLDAFVAERRKIAARYPMLIDDARVTLPTEKGYARHAWHLYPVRVANRDRVFASMRAQGVGVQVHYLPVYLHPYYQKLGYKKGSCPIAEREAGRELSLPMYPGLAREEQEYAAKKLREAA